MRNLETVNAEIGMFWSDRWTNIGQKLISLILTAVQMKQTLQPRLFAGRANLLAGLEAY